MSSEVFRRVGRGGAGNFFTKKEVEAAEQNEITKDPEAQKGVVPEPSPAPHPVNGYARGGRGGAGNFAQVTELPVTEAKEQEQREQSIRDAVARSIAKPKVGHTGRGGVGNWSDSPSVFAEADMRKKADLEAQAVMEVDAGLAPPPRSYQSH